MAVLAESDRRRIAQLLEPLEPPPAHEDMRAPENGLVMIRGRIGGDGARFNLGEATVSRAVVRLASGEMGFGYVLGRDRAKAQLIALCDALVQTQAYSAAVESIVIAPFGRHRSATRCARAASRRDQGRFFHFGARGGRRMIGSGFADPVRSAQAAFRAILAATSRPGTV